MRNLKMFLVFAALISITACGADRNKYGGLILTDENTGKKYLIKHHMGDVYFIEERVMIINGQDTTYQFK
jgi:uncharacterized protein YbaR (Trm112 family)